MPAEYVGQFFRKIWPTFCVSMVTYVPWLGAKDPLGHFAGLIYGFRLLLLLLLIGGVLKNIVTGFRLKIGIATIKLCGGKNDY